MTLFESDNKLTVKGDAIPFCTFKETDFREGYTHTVVRKNLS